MHNIKMKGFSFLVQYLCLMTVAAQTDSTDRESHQVMLATEEALKLMSTLSSGTLCIAEHSEEAKKLQRKYKKHLMKGDEILDEIRSLNKKMKHDGVVTTVAITFGTIAVSILMFVINGNHGVDHRSVKSKRT